MSPPFRILCVAAAAPDLDQSEFGPFEVERLVSLDALAAALRAKAIDGVLIELGDPAELEAWPALSHAVLDAAVVLVSAGANSAVATRLLQLGVQDVLREADPTQTARALRLGIERKHIEQSARKAYATDLATGLPNHAQLQEHMSHLLALREREPAPMALIVLRVSGLGRVASELGAEAGNVLRRKVAVRLRAALRASDVVASIGTDTFAVLLAWIDSPADGDRVCSKLAHSLTLPFKVAGRPQTLQVNAGLASYPEHGKEAASLLRRALGQAAGMAAIGTAMPARTADRGPDAAANDDER